MVSKKIRVFVALAPWLLCSDVVFAADAPKYTVTRIYAESPYSFLESRGVNDSGHFFGTIADASEYHWIYWQQDAGMVLLQPPLGAIVDITDINNVDEIAVNSTAGPWIWSPSVGWIAYKTDASAITTRITSRNDRGITVGFAFNGDGSIIDPSRRAVKWALNGDISEVRSFTEAVPSAVNEHGDVVGTVYKPSAFGTIDYEAVLARRGMGFQALGVLSDNGRGRESVAIGLSENGIVAVNSPDYLERTVACYWTEKKGITSIGLGTSDVEGISRRGTMYGRNSAENYSFAWNKNWGVINIAEHVIQPSEPLRNFWASGISGNGIVTGVEYTSATSSDTVILVPDKAD